MSTDHCLKKMFSTGLSDRAYRGKRSPYEYYWSRKWQTIPVFLPGKSCGQRSLAGYSPLGHNELDMTGPLSMSTMEIMSSDQSLHKCGRSWGRRELEGQRSSL